MTALAMDVKTRDELVRAAKEGDVAQLQVLLREPSSADSAAAYLNGLCSIGITPLYMATLKGNVEAVRLLLDNGASPTFPTAKGRTPLFAAILSDSMEILNILVDAGASLDGDVGGELLFEATRRGRFDIAHWLVDSVAVSVQFTSPANGMTPLFAAASFGSIELATKFIGRGASINARTLKGQTPLFVAALLGHMEMVQFLIEHGAQVDLLTTNGETALFAAAGWGHLDVARELIRCGAIIDTKNSRGETPLFVAITRGSADVVAYLVTECGAALDLKTANGDTLLSVAESNDQPEITKILRDHIVVAK
ncbi:Serine/threonine protein kinase [Globisporangium polare]